MNSWMIDNENGKPQVSMGKGYSSKQPQVREALLGSASGWAGGKALDSGLDNLASMARRYKGIHEMRVCTRPSGDPKHHD